MICIPGTDAKPPNQMKSVPRLIQSLDAMQADLHGMFSELQQRLDPVLSSSPALSEAPGDSQAETCSTAEQLRQLYVQLSSLKDSVMGTLERLEL